MDKHINKRIIKSNEKCANCMFFSITTKKWAVEEYCSGYCCYPEFDNTKISNLLNCEWFIENK